MVGEFLRGEAHDQRLAEIEVAQFGQGEVFLCIVDIVRQFIKLAAERGMPEHLAGFPAEKSRVVRSLPY